jgi:ribosomal protein L11 methylase PrmA
MAISKCDVVKKTNTMNRVLTHIQHYNLFHADAQKRFNEFCQENNVTVNSINWKDVIHYFLKYRYIENWSREVRENYLPLLIEEILLKIPSDKYRVKHFEHYALPYFKDKVSEDFDLDIKTPTHFKLLLEKYD